jgi:hypothetical protein
MVDIRITQRNLVGIPTGKRTVRCPKRRWEDNINMDHRNAEDER